MQYVYLLPDQQKVWNQFPVMLNLNMGEHFKLVGMKRNIARIANAVQVTIWL